MNYAGGVLEVPQLLGALESLVSPEELEVLPCRVVDPEVFFAESPLDVENAKALCQECPVRDACLAGALERREPWGVWGGELFVQGSIVARKRPRGRPRKYPLAAPGPSVNRQSSNQEAAA